MKKHNLISLVTLGLLFASALSCRKVASDDLKDNVPYYQSYEVQYYKSDNTTSAMAGYCVRNSSGAKVQLSGSASVTMNGLHPFTNNLDKTTYHWSVSGLPDVSFVLQKNNGTVFNNIVKRTDISDIDFANLPSSVSKSTGFNFNWTGDPLDSVRENVVVDVLSDASTSSTSSISKNVFDKSHFSS